MQTMTYAPGRIGLSRKRARKTPASCSAASNRTRNRTNAIMVKTNLLRILRPVPAGAGWLDAGIDIYYNLNPALGKIPLGLTMAQGYV